MTVRRSFDATPTSVPQARTFVLHHLPQLARSTRESIALIVSELATNAVAHAATSFTIAVKLTKQSLTLEVTDLSSLPATPAEHIPPPSEPHGRGLFIVTQLVSEWGVTANPTTSGKTVWVKLPLGAHGEPASAVPDAI
jgi:anti-sigma regulatory factor (Ser/Thr protein kinase)